MSDEPSRKIRHSLLEFSGLTQHIFRFFALATFKSQLKFLTAKL